jgi:hypothetical protein
MKEIIISFIAGMITSSFLMLYVISASIKKAIEEIDRE